MHPLKASIAANPTLILMGHCTANSVHFPCKVDARGLLLDSARRHCWVVCCRHTARFSVLIWSAALLGQLKAPLQEAPPAHCTSHDDLRQRKVSSCTSTAPCRQQQGAAKRADVLSNLLSKLLEATAMASKISCIEPVCLATANCLTALSTGHEQQTRAFYTEVQENVTAPVHLWLCAQSSFAAGPLTG